MAEDGTLGRPARERSRGRSEARREAPEAWSGGGSMSERRLNQLESQVSTIELEASANACTSASWSANHSSDRDSPECRATVSSHWRAVLSHSPVKRIKLIVKFQIPQCSIISHRASHRVQCHLTHYRVMIHGIISCRVAGIPNRPFPTSLPASPEQNNQPFDRSKHRPSYALCTNMHAGCLRESVQSSWTIVLLYLLPKKLICDVCIKSLLS